jgi:predicted ester cyclase
MSIEENKALVRHFFEGYNMRDLNIIRESLASEHVQHQPPYPDVNSLDAFIEGESAWTAAFPDAIITIEDLVAEGDKVAGRVTFRGTHKGDMGDILPTGNRITASGIFISRFHGGKIVETWDSFDYLGFFQQLGVTPPLSEGEG